jgi:predicted dehydrogenase
MAYWEETTLDPVRTAVVGLGYWGPNLVRNLHELPTADLSVVCDLNPALVEKIGRRYPGVRTSTSLDEILADESIEALCIATPVATHHPLALAALGAGKHVFVEKPLAGSSEQAAELVAAARDAGLVLMPGHTFLYSPPVNTIRELISSGELGDIYFVSTSRVNLGLHQPDASVVWDLAPHDFSILRYWLEETPVRVSALSRGCVLPATPDVAFINLEYGSGIVAHAELSWLSPSKLRRTTVVGSQKMVVYDDTSNEPVRVFDSGVMLRDPQTFGEYRLTYRTGDIVSKHVAPEEPLLLEMADFCNSIRTATTPRSSSAVGLDVVRMLEAVDASLAAEGRATSVLSAVA